MKTPLMILVATVGIYQTNAFAEDQTSQSTQAISFEDLKIACSNPSRFHNQTAPSNIQISCTEMQTKWVPDTQGNVSLPTKRVVVTSVVSNKYTVSPATANLDSNPQDAPCGNFKQVIETVETLHSATCEQLMAFKGSGDEYCATNIDSIRLASPESIKSQDTGQKAGLCNLKVQKK